MFEPLIVTPLHDPGTRVYVPAAMDGEMAVEGATSLHVRPLVSTPVTPGGSEPGSGAVPVNPGEPPQAWLPATATSMGAGVTVKSPAALVRTSV